MSMKFINYQAVKGVFTDMEKKAPAITKRALPLLAAKLVVLVEFYAPKDTGEYSKSWKVGTISGNKITIETPQGALYIILQFQGRIPGPIDAKEDGPALHFVIDGQNIFARHVDHPGFPPIPHANIAIDDLINNYATQIIFDAIKAEISFVKSA